MQHHQPVVECGADSVAGEVTNHVVAEPICVRLDDAADDRQGASRLDGLDRAHGGFVGALDEQPVLLGHVPRQERGVGVAVDTVDEGGDVDVDDVAVLDHGRVGDAVANDLVQRGAAGLRVTLVAQRRRVGAVVDHVLVRNAVELVGGDARRDGLTSLGQRRGGDASGNAHLLDHLGGLDPRLATLLRGRLAHVFGAHDRAWHRQRR